MQVEMHLGSEWDGRRMPAKGTSQQLRALHAACNVADALEVKLHTQDTNTLPQIHTHQCYDGLRLAKSCRQNNRGLRQEW
jgi:hypothetical protein